MDASEYNKRLKETGRNDSCPCGSGKKYKKCHLAEDEAAKHLEFVKAAEEREAAEEAAKKEEEDGNKSGAKKAVKTTHNLHEKSGHVNKGQGGQQNIPRRGAI